MQTILRPSGNTLKILGKPKISETGFRWMTYVLSRNVEDGVLLFHTLTRELLLLTPEEYATPDAMPELREKWFRVLQQIDDRKYADMVRFVRKAMRKKPEHITKYTIFTTTDCNARCFYCYEMGRSRITMSEETAHKAAAYIAKHCGGQKVALCWFGGEPLFNKKIINIICSDLAERSVAYTSQIVTNAYLFDEETLGKAVDLWKLRAAQITLDGTEDVYNRCKAFIYKDGLSPYRIVMSNIGSLLEAGIRVSVRMNMDEHNADDLLKLADELHQRFAGRGKLIVYSHVLFEFAGNKERVRTDGERSRLYEKQKLLRKKLSDYGMTEKRGLKKDLPVNACGADSDKALTILPDGNLGLCQHYSEDNFVGHLDREKLDTQAVQSFRECWEPIEDCANCFCYPTCIRLKKCAEQKVCFPEMREAARQRTLDSMQQTYDRWLKKEEADEEEQLEIC